MSGPIITKSEGTRTVKIFYDEDSNARRDEWRFADILYLNRSRNCLGDRAVSEQEVDEITKSGKYIYLPVFAYVHSGVMIRASSGKNPFNCPWDSGQSGIVCVSKERVRQTYKVTRISKKILEKVYKTLEAEVEECSNILQGNVYGFVLEEDGEETDSCWGFVTDEPEKLAEDVLAGRV